MLSRLMLTAVVSLVAVTGAGAATYEVGPGKPYETPSAVPWESLQAGDLDLPPGHRQRPDRRARRCRPGR